jgi:hypothetical protein
MHLTLPIDQSEGSHHPMGAARKQGEHTLAIRFVPRFAQDFPIDLDDRVCAQDPGAWMPFGDMQSFLTRHTQGVSIWGLAGLGFFGRVARHYGKSDTGPLQQFPAARRGRGEDELRRGATLFHSWDLPCPFPATQEKDQNVQLTLAFAL